jgi:hypothetical protein
VLGCKRFVEFSLRGEDRVFCRRCKAKNDPKNSHRSSTDTLPSLEVSLFSAESKSNEVMSSEILFSAALKSLLDAVGCKSSFRRVFFEKKM